MTALPSRENNGNATSVGEEKTTSEDVKRENRRWGWRVEATVSHRGDVTAPSKTLSCKTGHVSRTVGRNIAWWLPKDRMPEGAPSDGRAKLISGVARQREVSVG